MKCPNCDHLLQITERHTVEIDYCPACRGVWLDKGELDKIIGFANQQIAHISKVNKEEEYQNFRPFNNASDSENKYRDKQQYPNKYPKKKSFLGDLFDFD
jgi:Zn-finger nucleic acid-binding protein